MTDSLAHTPGGAIITERRHIFRIIRDLVAAVLAETRGEDIHSLKVGQWDENQTVRDDGLALDSLERTATGEAVNTFFRLFETGAEDYLLTYDELGQWVDLVTASLKQHASGLTFQTSGSTGVPKPCDHDFPALLQEVAHLATVFPEAGRVISFVPAHHIYGCLYTALLPPKLGTHPGAGPEYGDGDSVPGSPSPDGRAEMPVLDARFMAPGVLKAELRPGDLLVATPTQYKLFAGSIRRWPAGMFAASSTEPLPPATWQILTDAGIAVTEIYGSSETGGVGSRTSPGAPFDFFPHWRPGHDPRLLTRAVDPEADAIDYVLQDTLDLDAEDPRRFRLGRRLDGAVQVGGHNVFPAQVRDMLCGLDTVQDCAVRLDTATGRLKAFIVPVDSDADHETLDNGALRTALRQACAESLPDYARPTQFTIGPTLPVNDMGKATDWVHVRD